MNSRVKELRKTLGLTQQEFGQSIKISRSNVAGIESGAVKITDRNLNQICEVHNANKDWLLHGDGDMFIPISVDEEYAYLIGALEASNCDYKKQFIKAMLELEDESDWELVLNLVERLKKK